MQNPASAREILNEAVISKAIATQTESDIIRLHNLHHAIAFGFYHKMQYAEAVDELATSFDSVFASTDTLRKAFTLANIVETMKTLGRRSGKEELIAKKIDQAIEYARKLESEKVIEVQPAICNLIVMRAQLLSRKDKSSANDLLVHQLETIKVINATSDATEQTIIAQLNLLVAAGRFLAGFDDNTEMEKLLVSGMKAFPGSERILSEFAGAEYDSIRDLAHENPSGATMRKRPGWAYLTSRLVWWVGFEFPTH